MMLLAHGIGARGDLPLSVGTLAVVAGVAVFVSFAALLTGWKEPRFAAIAEGRTVFAVNPGAVISVTSIIDLKHKCNLSVSSASLKHKLQSAV